MRKLILLAVGVIVAGFAGTTAGEAKKWRTFDPVQKKWITVDSSKVRHYPTRSSASPIKRQVVKYDGPYGPKTIIVSTAERRLYYVFEKGKAIKYGIGVGREGFQWSGVNAISRKAEWPGWTPPPEMIERERKKGRILPAHMKGGVNNPLGARALYIGSSLYRIHGSNEPWTIGQAVSSGCIRMTNDDVIDLYSKVSVGTRVVVLRNSKDYIPLPAPVASAKKKIPLKDVAEARSKDDAVAKESASAKDETVGSIVPARTPLAEARSKDDGLGAAPSGFVNAPIPAPIVPKDVRPKDDVANTTASDRAVAN